MQLRGIHTSALRHLPGIPVPGISDFQTTTSSAVGWEVLWQWAMTFVFLFRSP
jgi:hypothetical protein